MIFSNHKNLEPYSNGQGYRLLYLLLDVTSAHVVLYGKPQYVQCTRHWLIFVLLKVVCIPFLSASVHLWKGWVISQWLKRIFHSNWFDMQMYFSNSLCNQLNTKLNGSVWSIHMRKNSTLTNWMDGDTLWTNFNAFWSDCIDCRGTDNVLWCCIMDFIYSVSFW